MKYSQLVSTKADKGSIRFWLNHSEIDAEGVLLDAQAYINGAMRTREMRQTSSFNLTQNSESVSLPTHAPRFLDPIQFSYRDGTGEFALTDEASIIRARPYEYDATLPVGRPFAYAIIGETLQFEFRADDDYPVIFQYFARAPYLQPGVETNWQTDRYPNILRAACLYHGNLFRQDDGQTAIWKRQTDELIARANVENEFERRGAIFGTPAWQRPYYT